MCRRAQRMAANGRSRIEAANRSNDLRPRKGLALRPLTTGAGIEARAARRIARAGCGAVLAGALVVAGSVGTHAQSIVVRSTGPSAGQYPRGQRLAPGATVSLKAADIVTILDRAGTRVLRGPGTFRLDGAVVRDNGVAARLSRSLVNGSLGRTLRAGAVRGLQRPGAAGASLAETIWLADVDQGGAVCVPRDSSVFLWRGNAGSARSGALASADQQVRVAVTC